MKALVFSHKDFDSLMNTNGWNDNNIPTDKAFISICCTKDCIEYWLKEHYHEDSDEHWFKNEHDNVINLDFDDIIEDEKKYNGATFKCITDKDAKRLYDFIVRNEGKDFYIHCRAGKSRSQAVGRFIADYFKNYELSVDNPCLYPNVNVLSKLKRNIFEGC